MIPDWINKYTRDCTFKDGGREFPELDCWGLVIDVYHEQYNIELPSYLETYKSAENGGEIEQLIKQNENENFWPIGHGDEREGDLILMRLAYQSKNGRHIPAVCHIGIVVAPGYMIHCERDLNCVLERYRKPRWGRRIEGFARHERMLDRGWMPMKDREVR